MSQGNLSELWEEHTAHEFSTRDTEATLATMVEDAYVNHIPVMTGGYGKDALRRFYSQDFIPKMPPDTVLTPVSRTVGHDQLVDEMVFSFTHTEDAVDAPRRGSHQQTRRDRTGGNREISRRETGARAYLLGSSVGVKADWLDRRSSLPVFGVETARKVLAR
jgi:carboxymethylenebutenolidase